MPGGTLSLAVTDWVYVGPGGLYSPPFVSRILLYRLRDLGCSILIHHENNVRSSIHDDADGRESICEAVVHSLDAAEVRFVSSATESLGGLLKVPSTVITVSGSRAAQQTFGKVTVFVERYNLRIGGMHDLAAGSRPYYEYHIATTPYSIVSPLPLVGLGRQFAGANGCFECYRVRLGVRGQTERHDLHCHHDWTLTALKVDEAWRPVIELRLERSA
jgi:hypothetical protein